MSPLFGASSPSPFYPLIEVYLTPDTHEWMVYARPTVKHDWTPVGGTPYSNDVTPLLAEAMKVATNL